MRVAGNLFIVHFPRKETNPGSEIRLKWPCLDYTLLSSIVCLSYLILSQMLNLWLATLSSLVL